MARQNLRNLLLIASLVFIAFLSELPRQHVEARTLKKREAELMTFGNITTPEAISTTAEAQPILIIVLTTPESIRNTTALEINSSSESLSASTESQSYIPTYNTTRSLYDELKLASSAPTFTSPFESSSEFVKFENIKMDPMEEDSKFDESMEKKFKGDEFGFRNNETTVERHMVNEAVFDEETVKYSSKNLTKPEESAKATTAQSTTAKKGKYLELMPQGDDNMNTSIPNAAEVWALAGMREIETRKSMDSDETTEMLMSLNNTAKNLLDWSEITKMGNDSMPQSSDESYKELTATTVHNEINIDEDPATSENKVFLSSSLPTTLPTLKPIIEDNRVEVETGNIELSESEMNKSHSATARIDNEVFGKTNEDSEDVELIEPLKKTEKMEKLKVEEVAVTTETSESATTESVETTTMENIETTTSIVDSFTVIGEDEEADEVFKRTITELPPMTTTDLPAAVTTTSDVATSTPPAITTTSSFVSVAETTTEIFNPTINEIPESTQRYNKAKPTKPISVWTTENFDSTENDSESLPATLIPKFLSTSRPIATTVEIRTEVSSSSPTIEIFDDDKFKYSTLLPEATTTAAYESKKIEFEESTTEAAKSIESQNRENLDGEKTESGNLGLISGLVSVAVLLVVAGVVYFVLKRRNNQKFSQRCRPVGLDAYSLDNVSVYNSVRRKPNALRLSKRSYGNSAFEDPSLQSNVLDYQSLQDFAKNKISIQDEFKDIPQVSVRVDEMPDNCEDKNRYANVVPLPETRVLLQRIGDEEKSEYINANFVKGPKDNTNYYIATQAPLENTIVDFWRMIWEQNSKVIVMATDLTENGVERCAEYIPASVVVDNSLTFGDFLVTMKSRDVKGKYAVSQLHLKNLKTNTWREIMHLWYSWPENGCPTDEASIISLLLEARGYLRTNLPEQLDENSNMESIDKEKWSTLDKTKSLQRVQGPLTLHCSPGTGRAGTLIACDIILRYLEIPPRQIDIPQIVYAVRRGRANAVRTKDQYEFIYHIANAYATKLNTAPAET